VVHRDIKPENILIEAGHAVVADFGIARAVSATGATQLTETGMSVGTPVYMSPEQAGGERDIDGRSDLYSLACVVYEMLGGQPPFSGPTVESVVHQHLSVEPPPITNLRPAVPATVTGALQRALAKNPADRYSPIVHFADALQTAVPTAEATSRSPLLLGAGAIALVALAAFVVTRSPLPSSGTAPGGSVAVVPFDNFSPSTEDAYFANGITEEITSQLSRVGDLRVVSRIAVSRALESEMSLAEIATTLNVGAILEGSVRKAGDRVLITAQLIDASTNDHLWSQDYDRELSDIFAIQREVALAIVSALEAELTNDEQDMIDAPPTVEITAYNLYLRDRELRGNRPDENRAAIELLRQAVSIDSTFVVAWSRLAWRYVWEAQLGNPTAVDTAVVIARRALAMDPDLPDAHYALGSAYRRRNMSARLAWIPNTGRPYRMAAFLPQRLESWPARWSWPPARCPGLPTSRIHELTSQYRCCGSATINAPRTGCSWRNRKGWRITGSTSCGSCWTCCAVARRQPSTGP
jgi:serine/threonine-protein kinase